MRLLTFPKSITESIFIGTKTRLVPKWGFMFGIIPILNLESQVTESMKVRGRSLVQNVEIDFEYQVELGNKIDEIKIDDKLTLKGIIPIQDLGNNKYICCLDWYEAKE
jgi:hypothetical protein